MKPTLKDIEPRNSAFRKRRRIRNIRGSASDSGTPQSGLVSPVLANIYLHYVLACSRCLRLRPPRYRAGRKAGYQAPG